MSIHIAAQQRPTFQPRHPQFITERLRLTPLDTDSTKLIADIGKDPDVVKTLIGDWSTADRRTKFAHHWLSENQENGIWGAFDHTGEFGERDRFIGFFSTEPPVPEIGQGPGIFYAFSRECWGKGVASEAARTIVSHLIHVQKVPALEAMVLPQVNPASCRMLEKLGMKEVGRYPISKYSGNQCQPTINYEIWRVRTSSVENALDNLRQAAFKIGMYLGEDFGNISQVSKKLLDAGKKFSGTIDVFTWKQALEQAMEAGLQENGWIYYRLAR